MNISFKEDNLSNNIPLKSEGLLHPNPIDKANILNNKFQKAFTENTPLNKKEFDDCCISLVVNTVVCSARGCELDPRARACFQRNFLRFELSENFLSDWVLC